MSKISGEWIVGKLEQLRAEADEPLSVVDWDRLIALLKYIHCDHQWEWLDPDASGPAAGMGAKQCICKVCNLPRAE